VYYMEMLRGSVVSGCNELPTQNVLRPAFANILFMGSPDCVLPDASGKFFAHF